MIHYEDAAQKHANEFILRVVSIIAYEYGSLSFMSKIAHSPFPDLISPFGLDISILTERIRSQPSRPNSVQGIF
jgi:hypothetical protein